jgi:hypothetical protein
LRFRGCGQKQEQQNGQEATHLISFSSFISFRFVARISGARTREVCAVAVPFLPATPAEPEFSVRF